MISGQQEILFFCYVCMARQHEKFVSFKI